MKKLIATVLSLICAAVVFASDSSLSGSWKVESDVSGSTSASILTLAQDAQKLTGSIKMPDGQVLTVTGTVDGNKVKWSFVKKWEGNSLTITYTGTVDEAGTITGSTEVQPMGIEGTFVAKKQAAK
ncbi:MAG: hypothetical protein ABIO94_07405 [Opitutaceae bacterium]